MENNKARRNITIDRELNNLCNKLGINVSKECNRFLKLLTSMEYYDEEEILKRIAENKQEIKDKNKEILIFQDMLEKMRSKRLTDKKEQENKLIWNKLISEYRNNLKINPEHLQKSIKQLNMTEDEIIQEIERKLNY